MGRGGQLIHEEATLQSQLCVLLTTAVRSGTAAAAGIGGGELSDQSRLGHSKQNAGIKAEITECS